MTQKLTLGATVGLCIGLLVAADAVRPVQIVNARPVRKLNGISLEGFGGTPDSSLFPLQKCQGDCDTDDDCEGNLVCFQREAGGGAVPGCSGGEDATSKTDFCVERVAASQARNGDGGSSTLSFETTGASFVSSHPDDFSGASSTAMILGGILSVATFLLMV